MNWTRAIWCQGVAIAALAGAAPAAGPRLPRDPAPTVPRAEAQRPRAGVSDHETHTLPLGPTGSLELKNVAGDIVVSAGAGRDVIVDIVRTSRARNDADAVRGLAEAKVAVERNGNQAVVEMRYPDRQAQSPYSVSAAYTVTAPRGTRIRAVSISGTVTVSQIAGDTSLQTVSGRIDVRSVERLSQVRSVSGHIVIADSGTDGGLNAGTVSGDITIDRVRAGRIDADTISGGITIRDATVEAVRLSSLSGGISYTGLIAPRGRYELNSHSGQIEVNVTSGSGFEIRTSSFSGGVSLGPGIDLQSVSRGRASLRGTYGDGSALIVASTFSGRIAINKR